MIDEQQLQLLRTLFRTHDFYLKFTSEQARPILDQIIDHPFFPGSTDPPVLAFLGALLHIVQPRRMLQLGTFIGFSTVYIADILSRSTQPGHLVTVEPDDTAHQLAKAWVDQAGMNQVVTFLDGYSTDSAIDASLRELGPFDLIYLDSSHAYEATLQELRLIFEQSNWLTPNGLLLLHDASAYATQWDSSGKGGVRRALLEWVQQHTMRYQLLILEPPLWPGVCGLALMTPYPATVSAHPSEQDRNKELEAIIAAKNTHIAKLEQTIRQIEAGRIMRVMKMTGKVRRYLGRKSK